MFLIIKIIRNIIIQDFLLFEALIWEWELTTKVCNKMSNDILYIADFFFPNTKLDPNSFTSYTSSLSEPQALLVANAYKVFSFIFNISAELCNHWIPLELAYLVATALNKHLHFRTSSQGLWASSSKNHGKIIQKQNNNLSFLRNFSMRELQIQYKFSTIKGMNCS